MRTAGSNNTLNAALELKLKEQSNVVVKYVQRNLNSKIESGVIEYIMDSRGLLYLVDLSKVLCLIVQESSQPELRPKDSSCRRARRDSRIIQTPARTSP